ncbi:MAG: 5'-methylthioadenosine/S-adenosylhomocysteine nucleosidase [Hyphomicrobiales bacterium]|nr:MAG: 5'-methylthioadenosine/S-adenosylhomocysteine nucleosidase [Hyphomicrobiales bacterium]
MAFEIKQIDNKKILYVMAADAEYGTHLQKRFSPLMTGVGPVEAAMVLSDTLSQLRSKNGSPNLVVSLGSAGSRTLEQVKIYQASSLSYRDMDASPLGFEKGRTPFLDLPAEVNLALQLPGVPSARLSTGANIISGDAYEHIDADMVDMESFAILRACQFFEVPMIALRGISDGKDDLNHVDDWTEYLHLIDEKLAAVVDNLEASIRENQLAI